MDVKLPKLGEGADSGVVVGIFVKEGDTVAKDQAILELENEKAVASIPSTAAGVVEKVHVKSGDRGALAHHHARSIPAKHPRFHCVVRRRALVPRAPYLRIHRIDRNRSHIDQ